MDGLPGATGATGSAGSTGPTGPAGPAAPPRPSQGMGLTDTATFSFVNEAGEPGRTCSGTSELLNLLHRKYQPLTYIGLIWSSDTPTSYTVDVKDVSNRTILTFEVPASPVVSVKNVYEIFTNPPPTTLFTRLLKVYITVPSPAKVSLFSCMVGFN